MKVKVKCIDAAGMGGILLKGMLYDAIRRQQSGTNLKGYEVTLKPGAPPLWMVEYRFVEVKVLKIKCINDKDGTYTANGSSFSLVLGSIYNAIQESSGYEIIPSGPVLHWRPYFRADRFVLLDEETPDTVRSNATTLPAPPGPEVDVEEERLRAAFTRPRDDGHTCRSCAMPLPCKYHPLPATCKPSTGWTIG